MFETDFEAAPPPPPEPEVVSVEPEVPPPPTFSEDELAAARQQAYADGLADGTRSGQAEAMAGQTQQLNEVLARLDVQLNQLLKVQLDNRAEVIDRSVQVALTITRKLVPSFAARHGLSEIEGLVRQCMAQLNAEPRLVIRTHDSLLDEVTAKVQAMAEAQGFEGKLVFIGDEQMGPGDCRLEWADGGAERDEARIWADVDRVVANARVGQPATASQAASSQDTPLPGAGSGATNVEG